MKRILIFTLTTVFLIIAAAVVLPIIYKDDVIKIVKQEINKNVNAEVNFSSVSLSLFRSFPHFSLGIQDLTVSGEDVFQYDTLAQIPQFHATIDLLSVVGSGPFKVVNITLREPKIKVVVLEDGSANYDIAAGSDEMPGEKPTGAQSEEVVMIMQKVNIVDADIIYDDATIPVRVEARNLDHILKGDLTQTSTLLNTFTSSTDVIVIYDEVQYLAGAEAEIDANINVNFNTMRFDFADNLIRVNAIPLKAEGFFQMLDDGYDMDIIFNSRTDSFKPLLSMVPAIYTEGFETIETEGKLTFRGWVRGKYNDNNLPGYRVDLIVEEGMFKYPELPSKVEDIEIRANINNPTGVTDELDLKVENFSMLMAGSQFNSFLEVKTPISDPEINSRLSGTIDLSKIQDVYPLERGMNLAGKVSLDANLGGKMSALEEERYRDFKALGYLLLQNIRYSDSEYDLVVRRGQFNLSPEYIDMAALEMEIGNSDLKADGKLLNALSYILHDGTIVGQLNLQSERLDINELVPESGGETSGESEEAIEAVVVPERLDFSLNTSVDQLLYSNLVLSDVAGKVTVKNQKIMLDELSTSTLDGSMMLSGSYAYDGNREPEVALNYELKNVSVNKTAVAFTAFSQYAPIAKKANGEVSTSFSLSTKLDKNMQPLFETLNSSGIFSADVLSFGDVNTLQKLGNTLKVNELKNPKIEDFNIDFEITNGKLFVRPFDMQLNGMKATLGGSTGLDQSIDYGLKLDIPRSKLGSDVNNLLDQISGKVSDLGVDFDTGDLIKLNTKITGTLSKPILTPSLYEEGPGFKDKLKEKIESTIDEEKEKAKEKAQEELQKQIEKAETKAEKLMQKAQEQADKIRAEAAGAAQKVRNKSDQEAQSLIEEAKGKGALAKIAAEKAAKELKKAGYKKADKLEKEADKPAQKIIDEARAKGDELIEKAKQKNEGVN